MSKKTKRQDPETQHERDLATFERLPKNTQELMHLKDRDEKSTGLEHVVITRKIEDKAHKSRA